MGFVIPIVFMLIAIAVALNGVFVYHHQKKNEGLAVAAAGVVLMFVSAWFGFGLLYAVIASFALVMLAAHWLNLKAPSSINRGVLMLSSALCVMVAMLSVGRYLIGCKELSKQGKRISRIESWQKARMRQSGRLLARQLEGHTVLFLVRSDKPSDMDDATLAGFKKGLAGAGDIVGTAALQKGGVLGYSVKDFDDALGSRGGYDMVVLFVDLPIYRLDEMAFFKLEEKTRPKVILAVAHGYGLKQLLELGWVSAAVVSDGTTKPLNVLGGGADIDKKFTTKDARALAAKIYIYVDAANFGMVAKKYPRLFPDSPKLVALLREPDAEK